jgi:hypothetical protein
MAPSATGGMFTLLLLIADGDPHRPRKYLEVEIKKEVRMQTRGSEQNKR